MNKLISISLVFLAINQGLFGQKIVPTPADLYTDAIEFMYSGDYQDALPLLLNLRDNNNETANVNYLIGECYMNIAGQKYRAIPFLKDACRNISDKYTGKSFDEQYAPVKTYLYLGIAYRLNYNFESAIQNLNNYIQALDDADIDNRKLAEYHIERCNNARELMAAPAKFSADTLPAVINGGSYNFNAVVSANEKSIFFMNRLKFYDAIMHAEKIDDQWQAPENMTPLVKSDGDHYLTGVSSDGKQLFFTCYNPYKSGEIYTSRYTDNAWSELQKLNDQVNTIFNENYATLSPDSKTLYFISDRKGGYGGADIYRTDINEKGEWGRPVNLGPMINSQYNEASPFLTPDGKRLYFSSQGHYNMGGFDIFYAESDSDHNWLPPVNIGYPLNTTDDDLFFFPVDSGNTAYQSRLSRFQAHPDIIRYKVISFGNPARFMINGKVDIQSSPDYGPENISVCFISKPARDTISLKNLNEDGSFRQSLSAGNYQIDFLDDKTRLLTKNVDIPAYLPHNTLVMHEQISIPESVISIKDTFRIRDIRFEFNKSSLNDQYIGFLDELAMLMAKYPDISLQLKGFTDALGSDKYNLSLSAQRAENVREFLSTRLGSSERIVINAMGEREPIALNNLNGADNPQGRSYNRRVEIIVLNVPDTLIIIKIKDIPESILAR